MSDKQTDGALTKAKLHEVNLPPEILARGFWLYAWKIVGPANELLCYVGMTGDVTGVAQSPFARAGAHFGFNKNSNAIRRHLARRHIEPEKCKRFRFYVYGPVLPYWHAPPRHDDFRASRKRVGALEKQLWNTIRNAGYTLLNKEPQSREDFDRALWKEVKAAFSHAFGLPD